MGPAPLPAMPVRLMLALGDAEPVEIATVETDWSIRTRRDGTLVFSVRRFRRSMRKMFRALARGVR